MIDVTYVWKTALHTVIFIVHNTGNIHLIELAPAYPDTMSVLLLLQGIAQVSFTVFHYDPEVLQSVGVVTASSLDLLDNIFINSVSLPPSAPPTLDTAFSGSFGRISVIANFQVVCASGFFGTDCSTTCETRDDSLGHFTCDPVTGERLCLEGYTGVEENCTECEPSPGCCESEYKF